MLFVDSSHEQQTNRLPHSPKSGPNYTLEVAKYLAPIGLVRLSGIVKGQIERSPVPDRLKPRLIAIYSQSHIIQTMLNESEAFTLDIESSQPPASLSDLPLIVLTAGKSDQEPGPDMSAAYLEQRRKVWNELQRELTALSSTGKQIVANESGHAMHFDQPALLIASVNELVQEVRAQRQQAESGDALRAR
jgi:hypothetical protein